MKAYWIAHVDVTDPEQYQQYTQRAPAAFAAFGGRFLARGGRSEALEGRPTPPAQCGDRVPDLRAGAGLLSIRVVSASVHPSPRGGQGRGDHRGRVRALSSG